MGAEVATHGDVYSYGILLLEMFAGKRPTDSMFKDSLNLHSFVKMALPERVADVADPTLVSACEEGETSTDNAFNQQRPRTEVFECLISIFGIGIACSAELPRERGNINDIAAELRSIRRNLLGNKI